MWRRSITGPPPDSAFVVNQPPKPGMPVRRIQSACALLIVPTLPEAIAFIIACDSGRARLLKLNMSVRPARFAAATIRRVSFALRAGGFSQNTCLPAASAWSTSGQWNLFGVITLTASSGSVRSISATSP